MAPRAIYLVTYRAAAYQRAHFVVFVPSEADQAKGTPIHVVDAPMAGYSLEFKRNYIPALTQQQHEIIAIGQVDSANIVDPTPTSCPLTPDPEAIFKLLPVRCNLLGSVRTSWHQSTIPPKRCQEWTMEFVRHLIAKGLIAADAIQIVQSKHDPPTHGIGLQPV